MSDSDTAVRGVKRPPSCIICGVQLDSAVGEDRVTQPYAGTAFTSHGHYGSTVFDPVMDFTGRGDYLLLVVCDKCLVAVAQNRRVLFCAPQHQDPAPTNYSYWDGEDHSRD